MSAMQGALVIDKPAGWTSHDVVARVRRILGEQRVGHTGTLDPFATGVLVLLIGPATRLGQFLSDAEKEYEAVIRLGFATDTGDGTGRRLNNESPIASPSPPAERGLGGEGDAPHTPPPAPPHVRGGETSSEPQRSLRRKEIEAALASLRGEIAQTPPMYSAKKVGGRKLYEYARVGTEVERKPVAVNILKFEALVSGDLTLDQNGTVDLAVRVVCSAGTYIRTLAEDFGKKLGIGAHVAELRRTRAGTFRIENASTLDRLEELAANNSPAEVLISPDAILSHLPAVQLNDEEAARVRHGIDLKIDDSGTANWHDGQTLRMRSAGNLIAVGKYSQGDAIVHPGVVIGEE